MTKSKRNYYINSLIVILLMVGVGFLPPFGQITSMGMKVLGIFFGVVYGWCTCGFIWPSFLGMILLSFTGYGTMAQIMESAWSDTSILLNIFFTFMFFGFVSDSGILDWLTYKVAGMKVLVGRPWLMFFVWLVFAGLLGSINSFAVILLTWGLWESVYNKVGYTKDDKIVTYMLMGICASGAFSVIAIPFFPYPQVVVGLVSRVADLSEFNVFGGWTIFGPIIIICTVALYLLAGKFILGLDTSKLKEAGDTFKELRGKKMTPEQRTGALYLLLFVIIVLISTFIPATFPYAATIKTFSAFGASMVCMIGILFNVDENGRTKYPFHTFAHKGMSWDIVFMMAASIPICAALESTEAGVIATVVTVLSPFLTQFGALAMVVVTIVVLGLLTQVIHNVILLIAFTPTLVALAATQGFNPILFGVLIFCILSAAIVTPGASVQAALAFGHSDVSKGYAMFCGTVFFIVSLIVVLLVGIPLGGIVF